MAALTFLIKFTICLLLTCHQFYSSTANVVLETEKSAAAAASGGGSAAASSCFAADSFLTFADGKSKLISNLQPGDQLLTSNHNSTSSTRMIMMLHQHQSASTLFHTLITQSGHSTSLTPLHLLPIVQHDELIYISAKDVQVGDLLRVMTTDGQMIDSPVIEVKMEMKEGFYAPLTMDGTLLVNRVLASCYANVKSHDDAHFYMGVLRWYDRIARSLSIESPFGAQKLDEIHVVPRLMYNFIEAVYPSVLRTL